MLLMPATHSTSEQPSSSLLPRALYGMIGMGTDRLHPDTGAAIKPRCRLVRLTPDGANIQEILHDSVPKRLDSTAFPE
jgi:hypothetical protein